MYYENFITIYSRLQKQGAQKLRRDVASQILLSKKKKTVVGHNHFLHYRKLDIVA